jgi:hypothetical protein
MQGSTPQNYTIAEVLKWDADKELELNPKFQRGPVWSAPARTFLIDSILRGYPIPKLLFRTQVDRQSRRTIRDVVDGQQRLRTIIDFANNKLTLGSKAGEEYQGCRYDDLGEESQDRFLAYRLTCEQLINASDEDVLEIFVRINSYTVPVNDAELRNARFDNEFSTYVKSLIRAVPLVWEVGVLSNRDRVRMVDQSVIAEVLGFFQTGVIDGAERDIDRIYERNKGAAEGDLPRRELVIDVMMAAAGLLTEMKAEALVQRPHFLMVVAAVMYAKNLLPAGKIDWERESGAEPWQVIPNRESLTADPEKVEAALVELNSALYADVADLPVPLVEFVGARTSTQRMRSRQVRFRHFCRALAGISIGG